MYEKEKKYKNFIRNVEEERIRKGLEMSQNGKRKDEEDKDNLVNKLDALVFGLNDN